MGAGMPFTPTGGAMPFTPGGGTPFTPLGGQFPQMQLGMPSPMLGHGPAPGFVPRSRRTMSVGGPPKAVLGGPKAKEAVVAVAAPAPVPEAPPAKGKKTAVKVPKETVEQDGVQSRPKWARYPLTLPVDELPSNWDGLVIYSSIEMLSEPGPSRVIMKSKVSHVFPHTTHIFSRT